MTVDLAEFHTMLKEGLKSLESERTADLVSAMQKAILELKLGNSVDGDWERARRALHELECALKWHEEYSLRLEEKKVSKAIATLGA